MDFELQNEEPSLREIPIAFRSLVYQTFRFSPLNQLGRSYYDFAARGAAKNLGKASPTSRIFLFGGAVERCVPGISDLDFLLIKNKEFSIAELWELRGTYFESKRKYPVLGEIHATLKADWEVFENSPAGARLWFSSRRRYQEGRWKRVPGLDLENISSASRLALCVHHYEKAQRYLVQNFASGSAFHRANFVREVSKAIAWSEGNELSIQRGFNPSIQMAQAYFQLQSLANGIGKTRGRRNREFENSSIDFPDPRGIRFVSEMVNRRWQEKLRGFGGAVSKLKSSNVPLIFVPSEELSLGSGLNFFNHYLDFLCKASLEGNSLPYVFSAKMQENCALGWSWGTPNSHLDWISPAQLEDKKWLKDCVQATFQRLEERVLLELNLIRGKLISRNPQEVREHLKMFCYSVLCLTSGQITRDEALLISLGRKKSPIVSKIFHKLTLEQKPMNLELLFRYCLDACAESKAILFAEGGQGNSSKRSQSSS